MPVSRDEPGKKKGKDTDPENPPMKSGSDNIDHKKNTKVDPKDHPGKK